MEVLPLLKMQDYTLLKYFIHFIFNFVYNSNTQCISAVTQCVDTVVKIRYNNDRNEG